jgi:hypothetical protein
MIVALFNYILGRYRCKKCNCRMSHDLPISGGLCLDCFKNDIYKKPVDWDFWEQRDYFGE